MNSQTPTLPSWAAAHALERARLAKLRQSIADRVEADLALLDALTSGKRPEAAGQPKAASSAVRGGPAA